MSDQKVMLAEINRAISDDLFEASPWEVRFLESVTELVDFELELTDEQDKKLEEIWRRAVR